MLTGLKPLNVLCLTVAEWKYWVRSLPPVAKLGQCIFNIIGEIFYYINCLFNQTVGTSICDAEIELFYDSLKDAPTTQFSPPQNVPHI